MTLEEVFRREVIRRCECGEIAIGDCDCRDVEIRTDGGHCTGGTERKGYCLHRVIVETEDGPACERCGMEVPQ